MESAVGCKAVSHRLNVRIRRKAEVVLHPFTEYFQGFEAVEAVRRLFGEETEAVLKKLKVEFNSGRGYMGVSSVDGHLRVSAYYLNNGDLMDIYLDIIHELVHVKQHMDGRNLRDRNFGYVDRPTEVEAFRHAVEEARRLGLNDNQILDYLRTERMSDEILYRLAKAVNVHVDEPNST
jgi:hypothetical protein